MTEFPFYHHVPYRFWRSVAFGVGIVGVSACGPTDPKGGKSSTTISAAPDLEVRVDSMAASSASAMPSAAQKSVLDELGTLGGKPIESLNAVEARKQPSPADAVMALLKLTNAATTPEVVASVVNRSIPSSTGAIPVRIYTPAGAGPFPVIVYYHGGGWVIATNDTYDASARALANAAGAVLVSVEYRKAPEHKFPAAHDDAFAAYTWAIKQAVSLNGDASRIALVGESAGGNLAIATAIRARDSDMPMPVHILAIYPIAGTDTTTLSYQRNASAKPLNRAMMAWFFDKYYRTPTDAKDPRLNLLAADLKGLPPVTIISAEIDPLLTEGEQLASRMRAAGVTVEQRTFSGMAHEFFGQGAIVSEARDAVQFGAGGLKRGFAKSK